MKLLALCSLCSVIALPALAQQPVVPPGASTTQSALPPGQLEAGQAVRTVLALPGAGNFRHLIQVVGEQGVPQPESWTIVSYAPDSGSLAHVWWADSREASDEGPAGIDWDTDPPRGFINLDRWNIDSARAFTIAEAAANEAGIGFDRADFVLRAQEISNEPLWIIRLYSRDASPLGQVYLSGETGQIKRTVWFDPNLRSRGFVGIEDSAAPGGQLPASAPNPPAPDTGIDPAPAPTPAPDPRGSVPPEQPDIPALDDQPSPAPSAPAAAVDSPAPTSNPAAPPATNPSAPAGDTTAPPPEPTDSGLLPGEVPAVDN